MVVLGIPSAKPKKYQPTARERDAEIVISFSMPVKNGVPVLNSITSKLETDMARFIREQGIMLLAEVESTEENVTIAQEILDELLDPELTGFSHYSANTYAKGCRGKLCKQRMKHRQQQTRLQRAIKEGRVSTFLETSRLSPDQTRFTDSERTMNVMIYTMLLNQGRVIPGYLTLAITDPGFKAFEAEIKKE